MSILITGAHGFLGRHVQEAFADQEEDRVYTPYRDEVNLFDSVGFMHYCMSKSITSIVHLAANCGGIGYNQANPGRLIHDNLVMGLNVLETARICQMEKVVLLGTVCMYPNNTPVPFQESSLWDGYPEVTNAPYGIAKKSIMVMGQAYKEQYDLNVVTLIPVNMAGEYDHFEEDKSHVIPALIKRFEDARRDGVAEVRLWGTGRASREFLYAGDCARGIFLAHQQYNHPYPVNLGSGREIKIQELAEKIAGKIGYTGSIVWDDSKPDGQPRRCLDVSLAKQFGFEATTDLDTILDKTIAWYRSERG